MCNKNNKNHNNKRQQQWTKNVNKCSALNLPEQCAIHCCVCVPLCLCSWMYRCMLAMYIYIYMYFTRHSFHSFGIFNFIMCYDLRLLLLLLLLLLLFFRHCLQISICIAIIEKWIFCACVLVSSPRLIWMKWWRLGVVVCEHYVCMCTHIETCWTFNLNGGSSQVLHTNAMNAKRHGRVQYKCGHMNSLTIYSWQNAVEKKE